MSNNALTAVAPATGEGKFALEKSIVGGITIITLSGTLDHAFEGNKVGESIRTRKLVVNMREVRRIASWGMSAWMDFLRINAENDVYFVECSTYAASQLNLVTGLSGHGKLVSLVAPFSCTACNEEYETLFVVPRDRAAIRTLPTSHQECARCGSPVQLEEYPAAMLETIAESPPFDIDDEVLGYLRTQLKYDLPVDLTRFRAHRRVRDGRTYVRMSGNLTSFAGERVGKACEGTVVVDFGNVVFDVNDSRQWRAFVAAADVKSLQLVNCAATFLEAMVRVEDLRDKVKVRTFLVSQECPRCVKTTSHVVDVADNLEQIVAGAPPTATCQVCQAPVPAELTQGQTALFRALPARDRDPVFDKFLARAQAEPVDKLEDCLTLPPKKPVAPTSRTPYVALGLTVLLLLGLGVVVAGVWKQHSDPVVATSVPTPATTQPTPKFVRPEWILSDEPSSAYCHDLINRLMCVGISAYHATRDEAVADANDAALEEMLNAIGVKISDPFFRDTISGAYSQARSKALADLQATESNRAGSAYAAANGVLDKTRRRIVDIFQASGGAGVPEHRTDWYWEEYAKSGGGTEVLVFVRYDLNLDESKALVDAYSASIPVIGSAATSAFPALAWLSDDFTGGAMLTKVGYPLAGAGLSVHDIIMAVDGQPVHDASDLAHLFSVWEHGPQPRPALKLTVKTGDGPAKLVTVHASGK